MTSSGKTYTMMGNDQTPGIIRLAMQRIFDAIKGEAKINTTRSYLVRVSYLEIYNEEVFDLLSKDRHVVKLFNDGLKIQFSGMTEKIVKNVDGL